MNEITSVQAISRMIQGANHSSKIIMETVLKPGLGGFTITQLLVLIRSAFGGCDSRAPLPERTW
jgi:hypothetical protein